MYHWGFLNFLVAAPIGLVFVWLTLRQARQATTGGAITLAITVVVLFFCHALICLFFGFIAGCILLASGTSIRNAIARVLPLTAVIPVVLFWTLRTKAKQKIVIWPDEWDLNWVTTTSTYFTPRSRSGPRPTAGAGAAPPASSPACLGRCLGRCQH